MDMDHDQAFLAEEEDETVSQAPTPQQLHRQKQYNFWGSLCLLLFALAYVGGAFGIQNISTAKWYDSPGLFPVIIGFAFLLFSVIYLVQNLDGRKLTVEDKQAVRAYLRSPVFSRLVIAIGLLAVYVFGLLGLHIGSFKMPYEAATFIYLFSSMMIFRTKGYKIWKIVLIALAIALIVGFGFSQGAKIPLP